MEVATTNNEDKRRIAEEMIGIFGMVLYSEMIRGDPQINLELTRHMISKAFDNLRLSTSDEKESWKQEKWFDRFS